MRVTEHLSNRKRSLISFEILPPLKGKNISALYRTIDKLLEFEPPFINVTYHRAEYKFKQRENGMFEKVYIRKRPGTVGICAAIKYKYGIDTVPHLVCGGFSRMETEDALMDLNYLGIDNVLLLRGDAMHNERNFVRHEKGHGNACDLVKQTVELNKGVYLEDELSDAVETNFCIGVAGYPEKHFESPSMEVDLAYLKHKVDCGADYIVTQMFYDNKHYFSFVKRCREEGIEVPIIPGIRPITSLKNLYVLPGIFHIAFPNELVAAMQACKTPEEEKMIGIDWTIKQAQELIDFGAPCLHFYTYGSMKVIPSIVRELVSKPYSV